jgi:hypothetical protein
MALFSQAGGFFLMKIYVSDLKLKIWAVMLIASSIYYSLFFGFSVNKEMGNIADVIVILTYSFCVIMFLSSRDWAGPAVLAIIALISSVIYIYAYGNFSTFMDTFYGGPYGWSDVRVLAYGLLVAPVCGLINAVLVFVLSSFKIVIAQR